MTENDQTIYLNTFFDSTYLNRAIMLIESVENQTERNVSWTLLALDDNSFNFLIDNKKSNWDVMKLEDLKDPNILQLKLIRPYREFCWSLSAILLNYCLSTSKDNDLVAYVDSDCYFYSKIEILFNYLDKEKDFFIHEHNFPKKKEHLVYYSGKFNVGVIGGRVSKQFKECISIWKSQVLEKCVLDPENGLCGDQTYLNGWPEEFDRLRVLKSSGIGAGPWNINNKSIEINNKNIIVDNDVLVFYHFHGFKYNLGLNRYLIFQPALNYRIQSNPLKYIYIPYVKHLWNTYKITQVPSREVIFKISLRGLLRNIPHLYMEKHR